MAQYSTKQIQFALTTLANMDSGEESVPEVIETKMKENLHKVFVDAAVRDLIGTWELVWGPKIDIDILPVVGDFKPINTMYIAKSAESQDYMIGIAGTDSSSGFDWMVEDFWVWDTKTWPYLASGSDTSPQISDGTNYGLNKLVTMTDGGKTAQQYLRETAGATSGSTVSVGGHSLGGALAPSFALYLHDTAADWNSEGNASIDVLGVAGPTPGDDVFADYYNGRLGTSTDRVWNEHDIVPHAWEKDMLEEIPKLYEPVIPWDIAVQAIADVALYISKNTPYTQLLSDTPASESTVVEIQADSTFKEFMFEACYQHVDGYIKIFGIEDFQSAVTQVLDTGKTYFSCNLTVSDIEAFNAKVQAKHAKIPATADQS